MGRMDCVSIIVPVYNGEEYLSENIESITSQTYQNIEVIYVCDGCTDNSFDIIRNAQSDKRIRTYVNEKNEGAAIARNIGIEMAKGDWIMFLDADDIFEKNMVENMLSTLQKENADLCCGYYNILDDNRAVNQKVANRINKFLVKNYPVVLVRENEKYLFQIVLNSPCNKLIKKELLDNEKLRFQNIPNANDVFFSMVVAMESNKIVYVDQNLLHYRMLNRKNTLSTQRNNKRNYFLYAMDAIFQHIEQKPDNKDLKISFYNKMFKEFRAIRTAVSSAVMEQMEEEFFNIFWFKWEIDNLDVKDIYSNIDKRILALYKDNIRCIDVKKIYQEEIIKIIELLTAGNKTIAIWGAGALGCEIMRLLANNNKTVDYIVDQDSSKWGKKIETKIVSDYQEVKNYIDIVIVPFSIWYEEIAVKVKKDNKKVIDLSEEIEFSAKNSILDQATRGSCQVRQGDHAGIFLYH